LLLCVDPIWPFLFGISPKLAGIAEVVAPSRIETVIFMSGVGLSRTVGFLTRLVKLGELRVSFAWSLCSRGDALDDSSERAAQGRLFSVFGRAFRATS
jgi:hypothetical protein